MPCNFQLEKLSSFQVALGKCRLNLHATAKTPLSSTAPPRPPTIPLANSWSLEGYSAIVIPSVAVNVNRFMMSTPIESGIPFEICNDQQQLRLLELPSSLLELILSKRISNLTLKSSSPRLPGQLAPNAVLCTNSQTYQVRQVQSSNSVFVLQPSEAQPADGSIPSTNLSAIAQCTATLELAPVVPAAVGFLKQHLPVYGGPQSIIELTTRTPSAEKLSKESLLWNAPFSAGEFDNACKGLCIFEEEDQAWIPKDSTVVAVWKSIISAATLRSIDLGNSFAIAALSGIVEEDGYPLALYEAVLDRLSSDDADLMEGYAVLSSAIVIPWLGAILLETQSTSAEGVLTSDFLQYWQDQLPDSWRAYATLDALRGKFSEPVRGRVIFDESGGSATASSNPAKGDGKNTRKWHEKFKNAR